MSALQPEPYHHGKPNSCSIHILILVCENPGGEMNPAEGVVSTSLEEIEDPQTQTTNKKLNRVKVIHT